MSKKTRPAQQNPQEKKDDLPEYLRYPADEDIYSTDKKDDDIDPDSEEPVSRRHKELGDDLDVPGSELDDADEEIGEEDEENNYYSLGGDDHDDLEEDRGDE